MPEFPSYISIEEASRRYRIDREILTQMVESGKIKAVRIDGRVAVEADVLREFLSEQIPARNGKELVSISEAARRLGLNVSTVWWWYKHGWLPREGSGPNRVILVDYNRACALARLRDKIGRGRGSRLISRVSEPEILPILP